MHEKVQLFILLFFYDSITVNKENATCIFLDHQLTDLICLQVCLRSRA